MARDHRAFGDIARDHRPRANRSPRTDRDAFQHHRRHPQPDAFADTDGSGAAREGAFARGGAMKIAIENAAAGPRQTARADLDPVASDELDSIGQSRTSSDFDSRFR